MSTFYQIIFYIFYLFKGLTHSCVVTQLPVINYIDNSIRPFQKVDVLEVNMFTILKLWLNQVLY